MSTKATMTAGGALLALLRGGVTHLFEDLCGALKETRRAA